jgi:hypothetical protein
LVDTVLGFAQNVLKNSRQAMTLFKRVSENLQNVPTNRQMERRGSYSQENSACITCLQKSFANSKEVDLMETISNLDHPTVPLLAHSNVMPLSL